MAVVVTLAMDGHHTSCFDVAGDAADAGLDCANPVAHGLLGAPNEYYVTDTTLAADENPAALANPWVIHTVTATTFLVRKACATTQNRTGRIVLKMNHSITQ